MAALTTIDDDEEAARTRARRAIVGLFHPIPHPYYDYLLREQGDTRVADAATDFGPQKRWHEAMATIDDELLDRLTFTGTPAQCAARVADYDGLADEIICLTLAAGAQTPSTPPADDALAHAFALARRP